MFYKTAGAVVVYAASSSLTASVLWDYLLRPVSTSLFKKSWNFFFGPSSQEESLLLEKYDAFEVIERRDDNGILTRYILLEKKTEITYNEPVYL